MNMDKLYHTELDTVILIPRNYIIANGTKNIWETLHFDSMAGADGRTLCFLPIMLWQAFIKKQK